METTSVPPKDSGTRLEDVEDLIRHELGWKHQKLEPEGNGAKPADGAAPAEQGPWRADPRHSLCGLALSGGGIRSATFNLGLLQGLQQLGLLDVFDYLATVSGGGYIGGFWTAWRHHQGGEGRFFPSGKRGARGADLTEIRHLREFSNFLSPQLGLLSVDTGRMLVAVLSAAIPALLATLSFILLVLLAWVGLSWLLLSGYPLWAGWPAGPTVSLATMFLGTLVALVIFESHMWREVVRARQKASDSQSLGEDVQAPRKGTRPVYSIIAVVLASGIVLALWGWLTPADDTRSIPSQVFTPSLAWGGAALSLVLLRWGFSRVRGVTRQQLVMALTERITSRLLLLAAVWAVLAVFWLTGKMWSEVTALDGTGKWFASVVAVLMALFARAQQLFGRQTNKPSSPGVKEQLKPLIPQLLAYVTLILLVLGMMLLVIEVDRQGGLLHLFIAAAAITLLTLVLFEPNTVGLHAFYRTRLARAFLGAAHGKGPGQSEPHAEDDVELDELRPGAGPLHLICCAANDLSSEDPMANLYRGAESAVLSPVGFSVGHSWSTWRRFPPEVRRVPTLAAAMTASGAAFNSHMGSMSMKLGPAVTFLMTAFNLRLGLWWPHPTQTPRNWLEKLLTSVCGGLPLYKELLGLSRAHGRDVLLSDGGHFENLAFYELIRRRCRYIVLSDCGMDSDASFDDFANAVRRVREDFGAEIRIDLSPLRPGPDGRARQPMVAGDIEYEGGDVGVLLLFKPTLVGNEPADILQYKVRNKAFPHETTGDQFYDEAQWESYRRLGEHAALAAFRSVLPAEGTRGLEKRAKLFADARYEWLPTPVGFEERFSRLVSRASELDLLLQRASSQRLLREVFKEIPELDLQAKKKQQQGQPEPRRGLLKRGLARSARETGNGSEALGTALSTRELSSSLQMIRRALLFMEEVFISENLEARYNHPAYLGIINYFARWAYSPMFRMWWPLLKTLYPLRFTRFLERHFSLTGLENEALGRLSDRPDEQEGFASACWNRQGGRKPKPGQERRVSYLLDMPYGDRPHFHIQSAQVLVRTQDAQQQPLVWSTRGASDMRVVAWSSSEFYVPPGLWGSGVGEDFLQLLISSFRQCQGLGDVSLLAVELLVNQDASAAERKRYADEMQLYRARGFSEPEQALEWWLNGLELGDVEAARRKRQGRVKVQWLVRPVGLPEQDSRARAPSTGAQPSLPRSPEDREPPTYGH
ncbi:hypothetical protein [Archangium sp.]|jgi:hypothetical protein|uniref:hypothetical protein n=1 Tax=Archangium sp. TaxID=1872627 RepID=UPI002ED89EC7